MKEATLTIRLDETLRDEFSEACRLADRPMAQVARELIRGFVRKGRDEPAGKRAALTAADLYYRREAVNQSVANGELEGFTTPPEFRQLLERYAAGEVDLDAIQRYTDEKYPVVTLAE